MSTIILEGLVVLMFLGVAAFAWLSLRSEGHE